MLKCFSCYPLLETCCKMFDSTENKACLPFHCDSSIKGVCAIKSELSVLLWWQEEVPFILFVFVTGEHSYKFFVNRCGTRENNVCGHSFFWSGASVWTHHNCYQKVYKEQVDVMLLLKTRHHATLLGLITQA